jgi:DNA polymerase
MERGVVDELAALRWQIEIGADEAIAEAPVDRLARPTATRAVTRAVTGAAAGAVTGPAAGAAAKAAPAKQGAAMPAPAPVRAAATLPAARRAEEIAAAAATREELRAALAAFDGCALAATATNRVFADGNPDSGLMVVGEGPGAEEDRAGLPFVGPSGQLLDRMLGSVGLDRTRLLITNLIPWRPPGNRNPTDAEVAICLPFLLRHIALVRPRRLVLLGTQATASLIPGTAGTLRKLRGRWQHVTVPGLEAPVTVLPSVSPDLLLTSPMGKKDAWADLLALRLALDEDAATGPLITHS